MIGIKAVPDTLYLSDHLYKVGVTSTTRAYQVLHSVGTDLSNAAAFSSENQVVPLQELINVALGSVG